MTSVPAIRRFIREHEGYNRFAYTDTLGKTTIGIGRLLDKPKGLSDKEVWYLFNNDLQEATQAANTYGWFGGLNDARQAAVIAMIFQMGELGFAKFNLTIGHLEAGDYEAAAKECLLSAWSQQTPHRAMETAEMIRTGEWPAWLADELEKARMT